MAGSRHSGRLAIIPADALDDVRVTPAALRVLAALGTHMNTKTDRWTLRQETIGRRLGISRQAVSRQLGELERLGYVEIVERRNSDDGRRQASEYRVVYDVEIPPEYRRPAQPDVARSRQPDVARSTQPDVHDHATSDVAWSTQPESQNHATSDVAALTPPSRLRSFTPPVNASPTPQPPPPQAGEGVWTNGRGERLDEVAGRDEAAAVLALMPTLEDVALWDRVLDDLARRRVTHRSRGEIEGLRLLGRRSDGALELLDPTGTWISGYSQGLVERALKRLRDPGGGRIEIVDVAQPVATPSPEDVRLWELVIRECRRSRPGSPRHGVKNLTLVGRRADGAVVLHGAPGQRRKLEFDVSIALHRVGDPGHGRVRIVEVAP